MVRLVKHNNRLLGKVYHMVPLRTGQLLIFISWEEHKYSWSWLGVSKKDLTAFQRSFRLVIPEFTFLFICPQPLWYFYMGKAPVSRLAAPVHHCWVICLLLSWKMFGKSDGGMKIGPCKTVLSKLLENVKEWCPESQKEQSRKDRNTDFSTPSHKEKQYVTM